MNDDDGFGLFRQQFPQHTDLSKAEIENNIFSDAALTSDLWKYFGNLREERERATREREQMIAQAKRILGELEDTPPGILGKGEDI
jgi:hypothetical protein